jgi:hypothetical protein
MADPCGLTGLSEESNPAMKIFPNPVRDVLHLQTENPAVMSQPVMLYDITGKYLLSAYPDKSGACNILLSEFPPGVYCIRYGNNFRKVIKY